MIPHHPDFDLPEYVESSWKEGCLSERRLRPLLLRIFVGDFEILSRHGLRGTHDRQECLHVRVPWRRKAYRVIVVGRVEEGMWVQVLTASVHPDL